MHISTSTGTVLMSREHADVRSDASQETKGKISADTLYLF